MLTQRRLLEVIHYDKRSGNFHWRIAPRRGIRAGQKAGTLNRNGGIYICVDGVRYQAHRLAWFYVTGRWPANEIDHRDLNRANNAWGNLREANSSQNKTNRRVRADSETQFKGVYRFKAFKLKKPYEAYIRRDGRRIHLGYYEKPEQAHAVYLREAKKRHGQFARST